MFRLSTFHLSMNSREYLQKARKAGLPHFSYVFLNNQLLFRGVGLHFSENQMNEKKNEILLNWQLPSPDRSKSISYLCFLSMLIRSLFLSGMRKC